MERIRAAKVQVGLLFNLFFILQELVNFAMVHGGKQHISIVDTIIANAISPGSDESQSLNVKDAEDVSRLYLEVKFDIELLNMVVTIISGLRESIKSIGASILVFRFFLFVVYTSFFPSNMLQFDMF